MFIFSRKINILSKNKWGDSPQINCANEIVMAANSICAISNEEERSFDPRNKCAVIYCAINLRAK